MGLIASKFAFHPPTPTQQFLSAKQEFCKTRSDVYIPVVFYKSENAYYTLIFSHGNATDVEGMDQICKELSKKLQVNVVSYEYEGYGHSYKNYDDTSSIGTPKLWPSEEGCYESITAACDYVTNKLKIPFRQQIWIGESIGTGPTVDMLQRLCKNQMYVAAMILVSPFTSATSLASPMLTFVYDMFGNSSKIVDINVPTLMLHGEYDDVVPPEHSQLLNDRAQNSRRVVLINANHNSVWSEQIFYEIQQFMSNLD